MELKISEANLYGWVRDECRRMEAAKGTSAEVLSEAERAELMRLRSKVQEKDLEFLGKVAAHFAQNPQRKNGLR